MPAASPSRVLATGNEMTAQAAIDVGCRFFAGYPITPASEVYKRMTDALPALGGVAMASPDEISALAYCIGASMRGMPAMTATSGPGWCLMVESVGYALMTETPVVIVVVQRLGPSTGAATLGAQGDIGLVSSAVSGGYTVPVFAPSNAAECYEETLRAFLWAEKLRTPVVVLSDSEVSRTDEVVDTSALPGAPTLQRPMYTGEQPFEPYGFEDPSDVPLFAPVGGDQPVTMTGSAHDKQGRLRKDDPETIAMLDHLMAKIEAAEPALGKIDLDADEGADTLVLSYGVSARAARDAVAMARAEGHRVSFANVRTLYPIPRTALATALKGIRRVVIPEENHTGLYRAALAPHLGGVESIGVNRVGDLITPAEIRHAFA